MTHLVELAKRLRPEQVVVVGDRDEAGQRGADALAAVLVAYVAGGVQVITAPSPYKDARAWRRAGATAADVLAAIDAATTRRLEVNITTKGRRYDARPKQTQ